MIFCGQAPNSSYVLAKPHLLEFFAELLLGGFVLSKLKNF